MDREKFQQKALKQTKQKKSKSAEFLMGNEYSRNYFDPLMDEEINPRQCGMEVSQEDESIVAGTWSSEDPASSRKNLEHYKKDSEAISADSEEIERNTQKHVILPGSSSLEQDLTFDGEGLGEYIPMSCLKSDRTFEKTTSQGIIADPNVCEAGGVAKLGTLPEVIHPSKGVVWPWPCWKVEQSRSPQPLQVQMKCIRGLKNKVPQGCYLLKLSLLGQPGGCVLQWNPEEQLKTRTRPVRHGGNFYDVGLFFHESLYVVLPPKKDVKLGMAFLFELFILHGKYTYVHQVVGWATFPLYDSSMDVVEGKFKCPLLRGHYDQKVDSFRKTEDLICLDLDHWLCNLYFQVIKLPLHLNDQKNHKRHIQLPPEFPNCLMAEAESSVDNTEKKSCSSRSDGVKSFSHSSQGSISNKISPCPMDCDLSFSKEDHELHNKALPFDDTIPLLFIWPDGQMNSAPQSSAQRPYEEFARRKCCSSVEPTCANATMLCPAAPDWGP